MLNRGKQGVIAAGVLAMAVAQAASADTISNGSIVTPTAPYTTSMGLNYVNSAGYAIGTEAGTANTDLIWQYSAATGTSVVIGLLPSDNVDYESFSATLGRNTFNSTGTDAANQVSSAGDVIGLAARGFSSTGTAFVSLGQDAWLYTNGSTSSSSGTNILTPTLVGQTASLTTDTNGDGFASFYFYTLASGNATGHNFRSSAGVQVNASHTVIGTSNRYTGLLGFTNQVGTDAWVNTGSGPVLLGLGVSTADTGTAGVGYYYNNTTVNATSYVSRASSFASNTNNSVPGLVSLDDNGVVVGMTSRFQTNTASTSAGADGWMYNYAGSGATVQIGLVGTTPIPTTISNGTTTSTVNFTYEFNNGTYTQRSTTIAGLNNGQVIGTSSVYNGTTSALGNRAWIYTPGATPGTATAFGNTAGIGTYTQIGLTDSVATPGSALNPNPASVSNMGHTKGDGTQTTTVSAFSNTGKAAGTSARSLNDNTTSGFGSDAWYFDGSTTKNISPWSTTLASVQYIHGTPISAATAATLTTENSTTFGDNIAISAMNATGTLVGGTIGRYSGTSQIGIGSAVDAFVYDGTTNTDYILIAPTVAANTDNSFISIRSISADGVVAGTYTNFGGSGTTSVASYLYEWTEAGGFTTIDQITGASSSLQPLNTALAGQPGWGSLFGSVPNGNGVLYLDGNDVLYGTGNTTGTTATQNGVWSITTPEPSSLAMLALGGLALARRVRKQNRR